MIHPTAVIEDGAIVHPSAQIGPFCSIGSEVEIAEGVRFHSHVTVMGKTKIGRGSEAFPMATLGGPAQIKGLDPDVSCRTVIGENCTFRECVTIHGANPKNDQPTTIGDDCYMMAYSHFAHDCQVGKSVVVANSAIVAGECVVGDNVWFGGASAVHQKTWIGDNAFVGGGAILVGDVPPFASVIGNHAYIAGLNVVGLKRRGFSKTELKALRSAYKFLFEGEGTFKDRVAELQSQSDLSAQVSQLVEFITNARSGRALCQFKDGS